ncbi:MAG: hypothetical protein IJX13_01950, partial [Clostridia bacterium]|nr:hypothetical protein [Clostridia bacterium]
NPDDPNPDDPNPDDPNPDDPNPDNPNPDDPDDPVVQPWAGEVLIRAHMSNGVYTELIMKAEGPITLSEFCQKYIRQSYEDTVNGFAWYFEGKEIDGDFVLTSNAPLDYVQIGAILPEFNENTVITKTAYEGGNTYCVAVQLEQAMTVREFCLKFSHDTFEELSKEGVWTLNGEVVDGDAIVRGGDTLIFTYTSNGEGGGDVEDPEPENPSMTITVIVEEDGKILQEMPLSLGMKEISLGEFCKLYMDGDFDTMTKLGEFFINGQSANAETIICGGDEVVFVLKAEAPDVPDPEEPSMTVTMITKYGDQSYTNPPITIPVSEITLKEFCEVYGEMDFAEMSAMGEWYINGTLADGKTLIHDGDEIVYLISKLPGEEPDEPEQPEMTVHVIFEYGEQVEKKPVTLTVEEITLGDFCKECFGTDYEQYIGLGEFYINGAPAGADAVLRDGDVLLFRVTATEPNPDDPEEGLITVFVTVEVNGERREEPVKLDVTEISVEDFCLEFLGGSLQELIKKGAFLYVNDVPATESMMIRDGDAVTMIVKSDAPNPDVPTINFVLVMEFANRTQKIPFELYVESITLWDFCNEYSGGVSYEDMVAKGQWYVNGELAHGDTLIYDGYEVRFVTKMDAPGSGEENPDIPDPTKGVTVWYNGQEYFVPQETITLYEFVNEYLGEDFDQGTWYVNGNVANEKTFLSGECDLRLEMQGIEHMH